MEEPTRKRINQKMSAEKVNVKRLNEEEEKKKENLRIRSKTNQRKQLTQ